MKSFKSRRKRGKRRRARACGSKKAYAQAVAIDTARALTKKAGVRYHAYKCNFCYLPSGECTWHVGHATGLVRRLG